MPDDQPTVVVAGHICLDVIPTFGGRGGSLRDLLVPGSLVQVGPAVVSTGGPVSNTGLALHRLGVSTRLMGKIGDDLFGHAVQSILRSYDPALAAGMLVTPRANTSYSVVISPPGVDRVFLHCPGANDTFGADDIPYEQLAGIRLFHFGYPPLMRRMYADGGIELESMFRRVKERGAVTSLDMARPDPASGAGRADWRSILERVLPHVDILLPSLEEIRFMLRRERLGSAGFGTVDSPNADPDVLTESDAGLLSDVAEALLAMNAAVVGLKLGPRGLYVRTTADRARLQPLGRLWQTPRSRKGAASRPAAATPSVRPAGLGGSALLEDWRGRECLTPCFQVEVVGTTGCGDCTIAGFLAGLLRGLALEEVLTAAVAVGACNVEQADAVSGVPTWEAVQARIRSGWKKRPLRLDAPGWRWDASGNVALGPNDRAVAAAQR